MLDFGTSGNHTNSIDFTDDRNEFDAMTSYSIFMFIIRLGSAAAGNNTIIAKASTGVNNGWVIGLDTLGRVLSRHGTANAGSSTTALVVDTLYTFGIIWSGTTISYYLDNVADGTPAFSTAITANALNISIGNDNNGSNGGPISIGHACIWPNYELTATERTQFHAGQTIPAAANLSFWHKGITVPGRDETNTLDIAADTGTVNLFSDPIDAYFSDVVLADFIQMGTLKLLDKSSDREFYTIKVPWKFLSMELMELGNISIPQVGIPTSASLLDDLVNNGLLDKWRRNIGRLVKVKPDPLSHTVELTFKSHEKFMATYFSTDELTTITTSDNIGLARTDLGGTFNVARSTKALLQQENNSLISKILIPVASADGQAWMPIGPFEEKLNYQGFLSEDVTTNAFLNSAFSESTTGWTEVEGGTGTANLVNGNFNAFPQSVSDGYYEIAGGDGAGDVYIHPTVALAVTTAQAFRRLSIIHANGFGIAMDWQIQRSTDSEWWNDSTPAWQVSEVWNAFTISGHSPAPEHTNLLARRSFSEPIPVDTNENWTINMGLDNVGLFQKNVFQVDLTIGKFKYSPIQNISTSAAVTTIKDTTTRELTSGETNTIAGIDWTGASTYMTVSPVSNISDNTKGAMVGWINLDGGDATLMKIITNNGVKVELNRNAANKFQLLLEDSSGTQLVDVVSTSSFIAGATWRCVMASWELGNIPKVEFYVGDADEANITTLLSGTVDYTETLWGFAADNDGTNELNGATTDFWFSLDEFIDFSVQANRRLFFGSGGEAIYTGDNGELPTGSSPDFYFTGDNTEYNLNKGTASDFTVTGSPANEGSLPTRARGGAFTQLVYAGRGTCSFRFVTIQDPADMATDENFVIASWVYGTAEDDYDIVDYAKPSGGNPQFRYRRFIDSGGTPTLDATAFVDITVVPDTEYEVVAFWTSDSDGELGLAARTLRIRYRDVTSTTWTVGTDDAASASHDVEERFTKIYYGSAPDADSTSLRAMNRINHLRFQPRVLSDEETP